MRSRIAASIIAGALIVGLSACTTGGNSSPEPTFTVGVKPAHEMNSPAQSKSPESPEGTTLFEGEWFTLALPQDATLVQPVVPHEATSTYLWSWVGHKITAYKGEADANRIPGRDDKSVAYGQAVEALTMLDGSDATKIESGPLKGWDLEGYYVTQEYPTERWTTYYFSDDKDFIRFEVVSDIGAPAPYDFMNTFEIKDNS